MAKKELDYNEELEERQAAQQEALDEAAKAKEAKVKAAQKAGTKDGKPAKLGKNEHWSDPDDHEAGVVEETDLPDERETKADPGGSPPDRT